MFEGLKAPRQLSFKNWRYKLLHWTFGVGEIENYKQSPLPSFLYTHFCPLFHLTNIIAIASPFILIFKVVMAFCRALICCADFVLNKLIAKMDNARKVKRQKVEEQEEKKENEVWEIDRIRAVLATCIKKDKGFTNFWHKVYNHIPYDQRNQQYASLQESWTEYQNKLAAIQEAAKARQDALKQKLIFWSNFSSGLIKLILNAIYAVALVAATYATVVYIIPAIIQVGFWLCEGFVEMAWWLIVSDKTEFYTIVMWALGAFAMGAVLLGFMLITIHFCAKLPWAKMVAPIGYGFGPIGSAVYTLFKYIGKGFVGVAEFVAMFYEENCPPIKIVSEDQEILAEES